MAPRDKRVDAYIAKAADFAQPIMRELRDIVHEGCPEVEEDIKWGFPHFTYKGILCSMAAFKGHCAFLFWKAGRILEDTDTKPGEAMGQFGRITSLKDLPPRRTLLKYVAEAKRLKDQGAKSPAKPKPRTQNSQIEVPDYFTAALKKNKQALATFNAFPYSKRKDYVEWVTEAKTDDTRVRRLQTSIEWLAEGKSRHWKYEKC